MLLNIHSKEYFEYCMDNNEPYFGFGLHAQQGVIVRHAYMDKLIAQECLNRNEPYDILEIGSYAGMSAITWAKAIQKYNNGKGKVFCVDPWKPYLAKNTKASEWDTERIMNRALKDGQAFRLFLHNITASGCKENIVFIKGESDEILPSLNRAEFDLIYIDGDHMYEQFKRDLINSLPLLKNQGIISGDDLEAEKDRVTGKFLQYQACIHEIYSDGTVIRYHPGITKGVWEVFGHVSSWEGFWAMRKNGENWEKVILNNIKDAKLPEYLEVWKDVYSK